jgi:hypothetical protein
LVKRKQNYSPAKSHTRKARGPGLIGAPADLRPTLARIDVTALEGRKDIAVGDRVLIAGGGLHAGEEATVESVAHGVIPAMVVRTDGGKTRRVRAVDLNRIGEQRNAD